MKIPKIIRSGLKATKVSHVAGGPCQIWHTQEIKQSANYNSACCSYGISFECADNDAAIRVSIKRAEKIVEEKLTAKFKEQQQALRGIS